MLLVTKAPEQELHETDYFFNLDFLKCFFLRYYEHILVTFADHLPKKAKR